VYATIEAVEQFVDGHYEAQIRHLEALPALQALRQTLIHCQADEVAHRDEAAGSKGVFNKPWQAALLRVWAALVDGGSRAAVALCRRV
jgi:3-demethoxyubiquinol 3-hydroxylase